MFGDLLIPGTACRDWKMTMMIACVSRDARFESQIEQSLLQWLDVGSRQICFCCESRFVGAIQPHPRCSVTMQDCPSKPVTTCSSLPEPRQSVTNVLILNCRSGFGLRDSPSIKRIPSGFAPLSLCNNKRLDFVNTGPVVESLTVFQNPNSTSWCCR